jgi:hypothetical protein
MNDDVFVPKKTRPAPQKTNPTKPPEEPIIDEEPPMEDGHEALDFSGESEVSTTDDEPSKKAKKNGRKRRSPKQWFLDLSKKKKILFCLGLVLTLSLVVIGLIVFTSKDSATPVTTKAKSVKKVEKPKTEASKLTGVQVKPELNKRSITGVMIENSEDARPQAGLKEAGVVYEAIAEGGITRFLALFQEGQPTNIGPVRSVRPYYLDWVQGFDAPIAHAGGSTDALAKLRAEGVKDLDQFANGDFYDRVTSRAAPHNLYTNSSKLDALKTSKGFESSSFTSFLRKKEQPSKTPTAKTINISISSAAFNVQYSYDAKSNSYLRREGGTPHMDDISKTQLSPKVVITLAMNQGRQGVYTTYNSIGSGPCYIFQDGIVTEGTWVKANAKDQTIFKDSRGENIRLNPGQTWISAVSSNSAVTYTP